MDGSRKLSGSKRLFSVEYRGEEVMNETLRADISGVNSRSEEEATAVEGDEGDTSLSPEEFGEYERRGDRERE